MSLDDCPDEAVAHGALGVVGDVERVARVVCTPRHLRNDGTLKPSIFPPSHLKDGRLSVMRCDRMSSADLSRHAEHIAAHSAKDQVAGVILARVADLRQARTAEFRLFCVIDDPIAATETALENPAHALITLAASLQDYPDIDQIRIRLTQLFSDKPQPIV